MEECIVIKIQRHKLPDGSNEYEMSVVEDFLSLEQAKDFADTQNGHEPNVAYCVMRWEEEDEQ